MLLHSILTVPVFALLAVADAAACSHLAGHPWAHPLHGLRYATIHDGNALAIHAGTAVLAAVFGAASLRQAGFLTRLTLVLFFAVLAAALPVLGIILVAALAVILRRPATGGIRPGERYVFGNPPAAAARQEARRPAPTLTPLAEGFRSMDEDTLCQAILGLKHLGPARSLAPFLQRFQQDPRTSVQFTAQAVLGSATETLEETIRTLRQRLTENPRDSETRLALADALEQLTAWTPPGDATTGIRRREATALVSEVLSADPDHRRALRLLNRLQLAEATGPEAQETAARLAALDPDHEATARQALLESLFLQARWDDLAAAARLTPPPPGQAESHQFWTA